jgi:hypothetical protein
VVSDDGAPKLWVTAAYSSKDRQYLLIWTDYRVGTGCIGFADLDNNGALIVNSSKILFIFLFTYFILFYFCFTCFLFFFFLHVSWIILFGIK